MKVSLTIKKAIRFLSFLVCFCLIISCVSRGSNYGEKTEISDSKDSLKSLEKIQFIKKLNADNFISGKFSADNISVNYRLLKPNEIKKDENYPLVIVFHGSGAIGTDNTSQMGILSKMWLLPENRIKFPAFVLAPQFPVRSSNYHLDSKRKVQVSEANEYLDLVLNSINHLIETENIDSKSIYVIGFSMGGATVSNAVSRQPDLFAAAINISGISEFDKIDKLTKLPLWIIHGGLDTDNRPESNLQFYEELKRNGKVFFWNYIDKYHNNILSVELVDTIPAWLFKQKK